MSVRNRLKNSIIVIQFRAKRNECFGITRMLSGVVGVTSACQRAERAPRLSALFIAADRGRTWTD